MSDLEAIERARALLARWHDAAPLLRLDPTRGLSIESVRPVEILQVVLRCVVETRSLEIVDRLGQPPGPDQRWFDPYDVNLDLAVDAPVGTELRSPIEAPVAVDCKRCDRTGTVRCWNCGGRGRARRAPEARRTDLVPCEICRRRGTVRCERCRGKGLELARAAVVARIEECVHAAPVPSDEHPLGIAESLSKPSSSGAIVTSRTAPTIEEASDIPVADGYRSHDSAVLVARQLVPELASRAIGSRVRSATVEVHRVSGLALEVSLRRSMVDLLSRRIFDGQLWVFDDPPRIAPEHALVVGRRAGLRLAGITLGLASAVAAVYWFFSD